ncbi:hypothetical protein [Tindallia californiensis]|uniref:DUF8052 domain-containing protein n=1 Tax=Tindallia californiensis TaxID=159292 RepID=A0A1H3KKD7_9FIRM|nr:hypothetical protein [Tindallia californiensis]SDY52064.1 hypothetical protein SAMN05192546_102381 [Tindallia californiensis]
MIFDRYLELIENRLYNYFDIEREYEYQQKTFNLYAQSKIRSERYFASKKLKVYAMENHEHVFLHKTEQLTGNELDHFWRILVKATEEKVSPHNEHMSTIITGVIVSEREPDAIVLEQLQKAKHNKSFALGFKGWVYIRLLLVNADTGSVYFNKRGKEVKEVYSPK